MVRLCSLKRRKAIHTLWKQGKRFSDASLTLVVLCQDEETRTMGYVVQVPRRWIRRSVVRNRLRRLLREALRAVIREFDRDGVALPFAAVGIAWRAAPHEAIERVRLWDVLPHVRELLQRAREEC
ncbi:MAG: ribonuclease P protein component [Candidatus Kapabacteria bacterium]|nr:ribonuclease P protein component [Candidatus Kapabacteria bacterium]MDW7996897.1 ribonuclease P protein component [Bacteroidota bacterium]MDW8224481.1 ribonuclease P protein component [Bacteroidota bacterium]